MSDSLVSPADQQREAASLLGLQSGGANWLLRLEDAGEIMPVPELVRVPLTRPWFLGLANVRGNLVSAIDFALFTGAPPSPRSAESRLVLVADRYRCHCALLVQRLAGLKDLRRMTPLDALSAAQADWEGSAHCGEDGALWKELNVAALVKSEAFLAAGL